MWFQFQNVYFWQSVSFCFIQFWSNGIPLIDCLKTILVFCRARQTVSEYPIGRLHSFRSVWTNIHPSSSLNKNSHLSDDIHCDKKGPFLRFGSLLGPYINFRVPIFSVLATFTRRMSIQSACIQQWVNLVCPFLHKSVIQGGFFLTIPTQKNQESTRKNQSIWTVPMGSVLKCLSKVKVNIF